MPPELTTACLRIRPFTAADAPFILRLLNEPSFIENIADRGVRTEADARAYLESGPLASYAAHGHGLSLVTLLGTDEPIGMCGLLRRDQFADADVGYALLPAFWGRGYAREAVRAVLEDGHARLGFSRIIALVSPHNAASARLLEELGFTRTERTSLRPSGAEVDVYAS